MDFTNLKSLMDYMTKEHYPGCAVNIYLGGERVFEYASGYSDVEAKIPFSTENHVNIYSCSKVATVTAAAQLLERGEILLNEPLYEYIPEYRYMSVKEKDGTLRDAKSPILVGDLFGMSAGFNYDFNSPSLKKVGVETNGRYETLAVAKAIANEPLYFDPGTRWSYSLCHDVLGGLIEAVSGMKFRDYVKKNIFAPLGMNQSFYHHNEKTVKNTAEQYNFVPEGEAGEIDIVEAQKNGCSAKGGVFVKVGKTTNTHVIGPEYDSGGAGIVTTTEDYAKFVAALANKGTGLNGERILSPYTIELMKTDRLNDTTRPCFSWPAMRGYGYGLGLRTHISRALSGSSSSIGEFGWGGAAGATVLADTDINLGVFFAQHCLNPREEWYQPRIRNAIYSALK